MTAMHTLEASGIRVGFGGRAILSGIFLQLSTGDIAAIVGRNGQGKSSLMQAIYGTLASESSVRIDGVFQRQPFANQRLLRYLPQFSFTPQSLSVGRVLCDFGSSLDAFLTQFPDFPGAGSTRIGHLSGGWIRILETYAVLRGDSQFVMLDEPFSHVSPVQVETLQSIIRQESARKGLLLTDHLIEPLLGVSNRLHLLNDGQLRTAASAADLATIGYRVP